MNSEGLRLPLQSFMNKEQIWISRTSGGKRALPLKVVAARFVCFPGEPRAIVKRSPYALEKIRKLRLVSTLKA
jgi:hypothetical protein